MMWESCSCKRVKCCRSLSTMRYKNNDKKKQAFLRKRVMENGMNSRLNKNQPGRVYVIH